MSVRVNRKPTYPEIDPMAEYRGTFVPRWMMRDQALPPAAKLFYGQLLVYADEGAEDAEGWMSKTEREILADTGITRHTLEHARACLRDGGLIDEVRRGLPARLYYRLLPIAAELIGRYR